MTNNNYLPNIICDNNATYDALLTYKDSSGNLIDLTGFTAKMQVRVNKADTTTILSLSTDSGGGITLGGTAGTIKIHIKATQAETLTAGVYYYDLILSSYSSALAEYLIKRLIEGTFTVNEGVTR